MPFFDILSGTEVGKDIGTDNIEADPEGADDLEPEVSPPSLIRETSELTEDLDDDDIAEKKVIFNADADIKYFRKEDTPANVTLPMEKDEQNERPRRTKIIHDYKKLNSKGV